MGNVGNSFLLDKSRKTTIAATVQQCKCKLILRKIIKFIATECHILRLKCTKFDLGWCSAPDPAGEAHSATPDPLARFEGSYF